MYQALPLLSKESLGTRLAFANHFLFDLYRLIYLYVWLTTKTVEEIYLMPFGESTYPF